MPEPRAEAHDDDDDDDGGTPELEEDSSSEDSSSDDEEEELTEHQKLLRDARAEAQAMLLDPTWTDYAEQLRVHCEEHLLDDVGKLYPSEEQFGSRETYRFTKLYYEHPGASFGPELLKANAKEHLNLDKVGGPHALTWGHIVVAYASHMRPVIGDMHAFCHFSWSHMRRICDLLLHIWGSMRRVAYATHIYAMLAPKPWLVDHTPPCGIPYATHMRRICELPPHCNPHWRRDR